jgi:hypothetical protein
VVSHANVSWYEIDLDRIRSESDALAMIVHVGRKRGVFSPHDTGELLNLFDRLGFLRAGRGA